MIDTTTTPAPGRTAFVAWLEDRFRERREWDISDLIKRANADSFVFDASPFRALPVTWRMTRDGTTLYRARDGWPGPIEPDASTPSVAAPPRPGAGDGLTDDERAVLRAFRSPGVGERFRIIDWRRVDARSREDFDSVARMLRDGTLSYDEIARRFAEKVDPRRSIETECRILRAITRLRTEGRITRESEERYRLGGDLVPVPGDPTATIADAKPDASAPPSDIPAWLADRFREVPCWTEMGLRGAARRVGISWPDFDAALRESSATAMLATDGDTRLVVWVSPDGWDTPIEPDAAAQDVQEGTPGPASAIRADGSVRSDVPTPGDASAGLVGDPASCGPDADLLTRAVFADFRILPDISRSCTDIAGRLSASRADDFVSVFDVWPVVRRLVESGLVEQANPGAPATEPAMYRLAGIGAGPERPPAPPPQESIERGYQTRIDGLMATLYKVRSLCRSDRDSDEIVADVLDALEGFEAIGGAT